MRQGGLLLTFLLIHAGLAGWHLARFADRADPTILAVSLLVWGVLPVGLILLTAAGSRWARWLLAMLFALLGWGSLMGALLQVWLSRQQPGIPLVGEQLVFLAVRAVAYLVMAVLLVRTRPAARLGDGEPAAVKEEPAA
jgi:predicted membrane channel-forming protein YqfA (hemolysin III family)